MTEALVCLFMVGVVVLIMGNMARVKGKVLAERISNRDHPPAFATSSTVPEAYKALKSSIKSVDCSGRRWSIKEDNPKGMLMAVCTFEEGQSAGAALLKRQIILTASVSATEDGGTTAQVFYNVYSPINRQACDEIVDATTAALATKFS